MKKLSIIFLSVYFLFAVSCSYSVFNPNFSNNNENNSNENTSKTMHFKLKIEGSSQSKFFVKNGDNYARVIEIEANKKTHTYNADFNNGYYMCNNSDWGRTMTTGKYINMDNLYTYYKADSKKAVFTFYLWVGGAGSVLILRRNITIEIPLNSFDENVHNNTALVTLKLLPDSGTYTFTLDGFENK